MCHSTTTFRMFRERAGSVVRAQDWRPMIPGFVYPTFPVYFGGDTKHRWSLLSGVYIRGSKRSHTCGKCVTGRRLQYSEINHSSVSPIMCGLEYTYVRPNTLDLTSRQSERSRWQTKRPRRTERKAGHRSTLRSSVFAFWHRASVYVRLSAFCLRIYAAS